MFVPVSFHPWVSAGSVRTLSLLAALMLACLGWPAQSAEPEAQSAAPEPQSVVPDASFVDEFEALDEARWYVSDGWVNGDHQNCQWSKDQATVAGGRLRLVFEARPTESRAHACAEVQSRARYAHGTYEVRLRTPKASGLNAAFFTYIGPPTHPVHDEIDFEFLLKDVSKVQLNVHVAGKGGNEHLAPLPRPSTDGFEDYAFRWTPNAVRFFIGGRLVHEVTDPAKIPTEPSKIFASLWGTGTLTRWMGRFTSPAKPLVMEIDRIAFTAEGEPCQFEGSVACAGTR